MSPSGPSTARPFERFLSRITAQWRDEAKILHRRAADAQAAVMESCAADLEQEARAFSLETLTLEQAVAESGYSYSALQKMVRYRRIPNAGTPHRPRVRRSDLPKKPGNGNESPKGEPDLANLVLAGNGTPSHIS